MSGASSGGAKDTAINKTTASKSVPGGGGGNLCLFVLVGLFVCLFVLLSVSLSLSFLIGLCFNTCMCVVFLCVFASLFLCVLEGRPSCGWFILVQMGILREAALYVFSCMRVGMSRFSQLVPVFTWT